MSSLSKMLKKLVHEQIAELIEKQGLRHPLQFAYKKNKSTATALLVLYE